MKQATLERFLGRTFPVLIEGEVQDPATGARIWSGYTPNFLRISSRELLGDRPKGRIISLRAERLRADKQVLIGRSVD